MLRRQSLLNIFFVFETSVLFCLDKKTYFFTFCLKTTKILKSINLPGSLRDGTFPVVAVFCWPCTSGWGRGPAVAAQVLRTSGLCSDPYAFLVENKFKLGFRNKMTFSNFGRMELGFYFKPRQNKPCEPKDKKVV